MINILHLSHTDIRTDSRILKEMNALAKTGNQFNVSGIGVQMDEGSQVSEQVFNFEIFSIPLRSRRLKFLPDIIRHTLSMFELTISMFFKAIKLKPKVIHCNDTLVLPLGVLLKILTRSKLIYDAHELESNRNGLSKILSILTLYAEKFLWPFVDCLIVVSPSIQKWYMKNIGFKKSVVILNSPVLNNNSGISYISHENYFHDKFNIPTESKVFLYIGILGQGRGIDLIVDVFKKADLKSHLVFLGYGQLSDELKNISNEYKSIHVHDAVAHDKVVEISKSADVGLCLIQNVSLSDYYCLPNKLFEYCFAGIPVLASNFPDISKIVNQYKLGLSVDLNVEDITEGIRRFESDELDIKFNVSDLSELGWEAQAQKLTTLYENVLSN